MPCASRFPGPNLSQVDYFETVKIVIGMEKCPYQVRISSVSCPRCIRIVLVIVVSRPCHILAQINMRIWQGCDTDTKHMPYRCNTDKCWSWRPNYWGRVFDMNVVRVWHGFGTDSANAKWMSYRRDTDVIYGFTREHWTWITGISLPCWLPELTIPLR